MNFHNPTTTDVSGDTDESPEEPLLEYFVEFRYSGNDPVGTHYDTTVSVPPSITKQTIVDRAAEVVASHVQSVSAAELDVAYTSIESVTLDATHQEAAPADLSRIELPERVHYRHESRVYEGNFVDVNVDSPDSLMEAAVVVTHAEGAEQVEGQSHHVPFSDLIAFLDCSDTEGLPTA